MDNFKAGDEVRVCLSGIHPHAITRHFYDATVLTSDPGKLTVKLLVPLNGKSEFTIYSTERLKRFRKRPAKA